MWNELLNQRPFTVSFRDREVSRHILTSLLEAARQTATNGDIGWRYVLLEADQIQASLLLKPDPILLKTPVVLVVLASSETDLLDTGRSVQNVILAAARERLGVRLSTEINAPLIRQMVSAPERENPVCLLGLGYPERGSGDRTSEDRIPLSRMATLSRVDNPWPEEAKIRPQRTMDIPVTIRFRDLDAMGHVNNATYVTLLEEARIGFRNRLIRVVRDPLSFHSVVAENRIRYIRSITPGEPIMVNCWISDIRKHSYQFHYRICNADTGEVKAEAMTVMVGFDYKTQQVRPVDPSFVDAATPYTV